MKFFNITATASQFLRINILQGVLFLLFLSCETEEASVYSGRIIQGTCGGTVLEVFNSDIGEEWINIFGSSESYDNVVLSDLELDDNFRVNQVIVFSFQKVDRFNGLYCDIGGLPDTKIKLQDVRNN